MSKGDAIARNRISGLQILGQKDALEKETSIDFVEKSVYLYSFVYACERAPRT